VESEYYVAATNPVAAKSGEVIEDRHISQLAT
jgi:hypothetical protein